MRLRCIALALAVVSAACSARAESWTPVTIGSDQIQYELDSSSIGKSGDDTTAWVRETLPKSRWDPTHQVWYRVGVVQRAENCRDKTSAMTAVVEMDEKGRSVSTVTVPPQQWDFQPEPPGSVSQILGGRICALAIQRAAIKAALNVGPATMDADWLVVGADAVLKQDYAIDQKRISRLDDGRIVAIERRIDREPSKLPDGTEYVASYMMAVFDCAAGSFGVAATDAYDVNGVLVATSTTPPEQFHLAAIRPGSIADGMRQIACASSQAPAQGDEQTSGQTASGTGWLAPKGYLITAAHVVASATQIGLAQDGKMVGGAEVVVVDAANDVAVLRPKFEAGAYPAIPLSEAPARLGEKVFTLGYPAPDEMGLSLKMTSGDVSGLSGIDTASRRADDARFLQISIPIQPGNSGGPVMGSTGRAVGIVISALQKVSPDQAAQNVNYALKIGYVRALLADLPDLGSPRLVRPATSIAGEVAQAKSAVFLVIVRTDTPAQ
jgi:S1-C subfamily serine protease